MAERTMEPEASVALPDADADVRKEPAAEEGTSAGKASVEEGLLLEDLLIEDISIDGMCGVY